MELPPFLTEDRVQQIQKEFGTPVFVYDEKTLEASARVVLNFPNAFGLTARFAIKALPTSAVIRVFDSMGLHIDASSGFEAERALAAGVDPGRIQITAQEIPKNLEELVNKGVLYCACSVHQLKTYGDLFPGARVCIRVNPGKGSGHSNRTNVGGPSSSFGIWHENLDQARAVAKAAGLTVDSMHTHIGSGADPEVWKHCAKLSLGIAAELPEVRVLSLGGGFKVARMADEGATDVNEIGRAILEDFERFAAEHGRELHLEVEPGTFLVANAGAIVATVIDVVDTGTKGYRFIKVDTGMTEILRPSMYGAQHPISLVQASPNGRTIEEREYIIAGHCCESGDVLTPQPGNPEGLKTRALKEPQVADAVVIAGAGAYCSAQAAKNYNSFPEAAEVLVTSDGTLKLIRKRQELAQMLANEIV